MRYGRRALCGGVSYSERVGVRIFVRTMIYRFFRFLCWLVLKVLFKHRVVNRANIIETGGVLVVSNHVSFLDPPAVGVSFQSSIHYLARKTLFKGAFAWLLPRLNAVPVDQEGNDMSSLKNIIKLLKSGQRVLLFPEGARSWDGAIQKSEAGVGLVIAKSGVPVLPVRVFGAYEALPRGASKPRLHPVTVVFGELVDFSGIDASLKGKELYRAYAETAMAAIAELKLPAGSAG